MKGKIYYNLTRISNGWVLNRPNLESNTELPHRSINEEEYFGTLDEALRAIKSIQTAVDKL